MRSSPYRPSTSQALWGAALGLAWLVFLLVSFRDARGGEQVFLGLLCALSVIVVGVNMRGVLRRRDSRDSRTSVGD